MVERNVRVSGGLIRGGRSLGGVASFKGIPYAAPPVGALRWRAPRPPVPWEGVRPADRFGAACIQPMGPANSLLYGQEREMSEDCLTLNVYTAAGDPDERRPVIVWFHLGGFMVGWSGSPLYDGSALASAGAVVVTVNYRLGRLGFLAHPALSAESPDGASGNYGLMDQIAALQWVQENIAAFGGDPDCVTIYGVSAGSFSVSAHMASPLSKGLFHRAIGGSGGAFGPVSQSSEGGDFLQTLSAAETLGAQVMASVGAQDAAAMRALSPSTIRDAREAIFWRAPRGLLDTTYPIIDGHVLTQDPHGVFTEGRQNDVPLISGSNTDEAAISPFNEDTKGYLADAQALFGPYIERFTALFPAGPAGLTARSSRQATGDRLFIWQSRTWARLQARHGRSPVFHYQFTHVPPVPANSVAEQLVAGSVGAFHSAEIPYVFRNLDFRDWAWTDADRALAETMSGYWLAFARTGNPNGNGRPHWPAFDSADALLMDFGKTPASRPEVRSDRMTFWDDFYTWFRTDQRQGLAKSGGRITLRNEMTGPNRVSVAAFDYVIIGGGSAGAVLASRLSEDTATSVLLLETGGRKHHHPLIRMPIGFLKAFRRPQFSTRYEGEPEPGLNGRKLESYRGQMLGGSSAVNGMVYNRGLRMDYDLWRQRGLEGWAYADVLPYFRKLETSWRGESAYHGGHGPIGVKLIDDPVMLYEDFEAAAVAAGHAVSEDIFGAAPEGVTRAELSVGKGERSSTARAYLDPAMKRPNLTVMTDAKATRILIEDKRAVGVAYIHDGKAIEVRANLEVISSAGPFGSPQLLMLSGIGPAEHLREVGIEPLHDLPGVGQNLQEHALVPMVWTANRKDTFLNHLRVDRAAARTLQWFFRKSGPFTTTGLHAFLYAKTRPDLPRSDIYLVATAVGFDADLWFPWLTRAPIHRFVCIMTVNYPSSRGWVKLRSADPRDKPRIRYNMLAEPQDVALGVKGLRIARQVYGQQPQAGSIDHEMMPGARETDEELAAYLRDIAIPGEHALGTCAMGTGPSAVVDAHLRVHGIAGLRVVDASVMPEEPGGNTNIPTIMIAEKAADMIRGRSLPRSEV